MKKQKIYSLIIVVLSILNTTSCKRNKEYDKKAEKVLKLTEAVANIVGNIDMKNFTDSVKYVKLETTQNSLVTEINRVCVFDNKIFIHSSNSLFVFGIDGKFIYRIQTLGQGPNEYLDLTSFSLNRKDKYIIIFDYIQKKILKYNVENGILINQFKIQDKKFYALDVYAMENGDYICYSPNYIKDKVYSGFFIIDSTGMFKEYIYKQVDLYPVIMSKPKPMYIRSLSNNTYSIFDPINNNIYHYNGTNNKKVFNFEFSSPHINYNTIDHFIGLNIVPKKTENLTSIRYFHESTNYIFLTWNYQDSGSKSLYDKNKNKYIAINGSVQIDNVSSVEVSIDNADMLCFQIPTVFSKQILQNDNIGRKVQSLLRDTKIDDNPILILNYLKKNSSN